MSSHHAYQMYAHITWHTWKRLGCVDMGAAQDVRNAVASEGAVRWARGYFVATIHRRDLTPVIHYVAPQFERHPDLIPRDSRATPGPTDPGRKPGVNEG